MGKANLIARSSAANAVRLQLDALAYNLANFMRTLALPEAVKHWSPTSLKQKLIKIGAKVVSHSRYVIFQMAEIVVPKELFQEILRLIDRQSYPAQHDSIATSLSNACAASLTPSDRVR